MRMCQVEWAKGAEALNNDMGHQGIGAVKRAFGEAFDHMNGARCQSGSRSGQTECILIRTDRATAHRLSAMD